MSEQTRVLLLGLVMIEMVNCKNRESDYFKDLIKAKEELS